MSPLVVAVALFVVALAVIAVGLAASGRVGGDVERLRPPWLTTRAVVIAALVLLGLFVFPRLFGFAFLFLPFLFLGRRRRGDQRSDGPERREG